MIESRVIIISVVNIWLERERKREKEEYEWDAL